MNITVPLYADIHRVLLYLQFDMLLRLLASDLTTVSRSFSRRNERLINVNVNKIARESNYLHICETLLTRRSLDFLYPLPAKQNKRYVSRLIIFPRLFTTNMKSEIIFANDKSYIYTSV